MRKNFLNSRHILFALMCLFAFTGRAAVGDTFTETVNGLSMTFKVTSESPKTCQVGTGDYLDTSNPNNPCIDNPSTSTAITLPQTANGYAVTKIGDFAFSNLTNLTSIVIPEGVTSIGFAAFSMNGSLSTNTLSSVTLPSTLTSIGDNAFSCCTQLPSIVIPEGVTSIGSAAFNLCMALTTITIPGSVQTIGSGAFNSCSNLASVISEMNTPVVINSLSPFSFADPYTGVVSVDCVLTVPAGTKSAYETAGWTTDIFMGGVYEIGETLKASAGEDNFLLLKFEILSGNSCKVLGDGSSISDYLKTYNGTITIPEDVNGYKVTSIGSNAFHNCSLSSITIPSSVTNIGSGAFYGCSNLTSITIPSSVTSIEEQAFRSSGLTSITIPEGVTSIGEAAFEGCESLLSVSIPASVTKLEGMITVDENTTTVGNCNQFTGCSSLESIIVDEDNQVFDSRANSNAIIETASGVLLTGCKNTVIPSDVKEIGALAFYGNTPLSVVIPEGVTRIGTSAFSGFSSPSLQSVTFPSTLTAIGYCAFNICQNLTSVILPSASSLTTIGEYAFTMCAFTTFTIPSSVKTIGKSAFQCCQNLKSVIAEMPSLTGFDMPTSTPHHPFEYISDDCVLTVPAGTKSAYETAGWTTDIFKGGINEAHEETAGLQDGDIYDRAMATFVDNLTYSRTFKKSAWLPWYVPFDMELTSEVLNNFYFAKFAGTYTEEDAGTFYITIVKMKEGDLVKGNTPYFVKAKNPSTDPQVFTVANTTLKTATENGFDMYSAEKKISIRGIYSPKTATAEDCDWYFVNTTGYVHASAGQTLGGYRFFLTITDREDNPYASTPNPANIKIRVLGEDGETVIEEVSASKERQPGQVYDLSGRRIQKENLESGIYIINGKKVLVK